MRYPMNDETPYRACYNCGTITTDLLVCSCCSKSNNIRYMSLEEKNERTRVWLQKYQEKLAIDSVMAKVGDGNYDAAFDECLCHLKTIDFTTSFHNLMMNFLSLLGAFRRWDNQK